MLKSILFFALIFYFPVANVQKIKEIRFVSWGFYAHRLINRQAIYALPDELFRFYKPWLNFIEQHAIDPDKRRYAVKGEAECHYIDLDVYESYGKVSSGILPRNWYDAKECYPEDSLRSHGIGPWNTYHVFRRLQTAFEKHDSGRILKLTADLGHYIGDMNVPLHSTRNYNGQLTNQHGIHALWESFIPERSGSSYRVGGIRAVYLENPQRTIWDCVEKAHVQVQKVLHLEDSLSRKWEGNKYAFDKKGNTLSRVYRSDYVASYEQAMNGMVEGFIQNAIYSFASLIFTAWVNAGQPDMIAFPINDTVENQLFQDTQSSFLNKIREHE